MAKNQLNSLLPLWLYVILMRKSSAKNPLARNEIEEALEEYCVSIGKEDRNKTKRYINALYEYFDEKGCKGAIVETKKRVYYEDAGWKTVPAWYLDRTKAPQIGGDFSVAEVDLLTDMVNNSQIISSECTAALIHKLVDSLSEEDRKEISKKESDRGAYKNENTYLFEIRSKAEEAIDNNRQLTITYEMEGVEDDFAITPLKIDHKDGKCFILGYRDNNLETFFFDNIRFIALWKELDYLDEEQSAFEAEDTKKNRTIALDALFTNTRIIRDAISNKQYISFSYCSYTMQDNKVRLTASEPQITIPIKTAYKGGKPYLIAIDPQNHQPVFFRIDLMKDISPSGCVDFAEYHKIGAKGSNEYIDKHPFMLSGFTKIRATFLIKADSLDRVIDAFGNQVTYLKKLKAYESAGEALEKLERAFPGTFDFGHYLGFEHNDELVRVAVDTTDEEAIRFALQNGDVAELEKPASLRARILDIIAKMEARHKK